MIFDIIYLTDKFILESNMIIPEPDLMKWATWFENADRVVAKTIIGGSEVSTVFLGLDHSFGIGPPILFETMVFPTEDHCERCSTWSQAVKQHERICASMMITEVKE